jgi:hypothetical protein
MRKKDKVTKTKPTKVKIHDNGFWSGWVTIKKKK